MLVIDNYDSFVYNLEQYIGGMKKKVITARNDRISMREVERLDPECMVISPGPGRPEHAGRSCALIKRFKGRVPILGVCLGHQAIAHVFGGHIVKAGNPVHGKTSRIYHDERTIFKGTANPFIATRYHSLIVERRSLPPCLEVSAWTYDGLIMGLRHREFNIDGVQFHPESILTRSGMKIMANFLKRSAR